MKTDKIREMGDEELMNTDKDLSDQLFRLRFQLAMGQTESLKKIRELRKDIARIKTVRRERDIQKAGVTK